MQGNCAFSPPSIGRRTQLLSLIHTNLDTKKSSLIIKEKIVMIDLQTYLRCGPYSWKGRMADSSGLTRVCRTPLNSTLVLSSDFLAASHVHPSILLRPMIVVLLSGAPLAPTLRLQMTTAAMAIHPHYERATSN